MLLKILAQQGFTNRWAALAFRELWFLCSPQRSMSRHFRSWSGSLLSSSSSREVSVCSWTLSANYRTHNDYALPVAIWPSLAAGNTFWVKPDSGLEWPQSNAGTLRVGRTSKAIRGMDASAILSVSSIRFSIRNVIIIPPRSATWAGLRIKMPRCTSAKVGPKTSGGNPDILSSSTKRYFHCMVARAWQLSSGVAAFGNFCEAWWAALLRTERLKYNIIFHASQQVTHREVSNSHW